MMSKILFLCIGLISFVCGIRNLEDIHIHNDIPPYFKNQLANKIKIIKQKSKEGSSFVFITDTHVNSNEMHSPYLIREIIEKTSIRTVIWGGDAINNRGNTIDEQWNKQLRFDSVLNGICQIYKVRGNHDFSMVNMNKNSQGESFPNAKAAGYLLKRRPYNLHTNSKDKEACYYFFDDEVNKIRYIVFDSSDSVPEAPNFHGNITGMRDIQLQWIADSAISTIPDGYGVVFISHIPISNVGLGNKSPLVKTRMLIESVANRSSGNIGEVKYNFEKLKNIKVLMCLAGHIHEDSETYIRGIPYITTASDGKIKSKNRNQEIRKHKQRKTGTKDEQCFDCFVINMKLNQIQSYRIGYGADRIFNLKRISLARGKCEKVKSVFKETIHWSSYNATGNKFKKGWIMSDDIVSVDGNGHVIGLKKGEAVIVATDSIGNKEFFNINVN